MHIKRKGVNIMKATGVVRRVDDLGRVVIPKEIRRSMRIREGDPLELYTTHEGAVVFKKYQPYDEKDWQQAKKIVQAITNDSFALYNNDGGRMITNFGEAPQRFSYDELDNVANLYPIGTQWDTYGYLYTVSEKRDIIINVLKAFLERE